MARSPSWSGVLLLSLATAAAIGAGCSPRCGEHQFDFEIDPSLLAAAAEDGSFDEFECEMLCETAGRASGVEDLFVDEYDWRGCGTVRGEPDQIRCEYFNAGCSVG